MASPAKECQYGYQCTFKDAVNTTYKCSSCNQVARNISVASCCGEFFCQPHLKHLKEEKLKCPKCDRSNFMDTPLKKIQDEILKLIVLCVMQEHGCDWEGPLGDVDKHEESCAWFVVQCPNACNQDQIMRSQLPEHLKSECPNREHTCPHCHLKGTYADMTKEHIQQCKSPLVKCPHNCGTEGTHDEMETHECHACRFSFAGCKQRFRKEDEERHINGSLQQHVDLLAQSVEKLAEENEGLRGIIGDGMNPNVNAEMGRKVEDFMAEVTEKQKSHKERNEEELTILRDKLAEERDRVEELEKKVNNLQTNVMRDDISPPEHQGEPEQRENKQLEQKLEEHVEKQIREFEAQKREFEAQKREFETQKREFEAQKVKFEQHRKELEVQRVASKQLEERLARLEGYDNADAGAQLINNAPPPIRLPNLPLASLTLPDFTQHKKNNERIPSSSFKDPSGNHSFTLEVWPNGQKEGQGTHISVWLVREEHSYNLKYVSISLKLLARDDTNAEDIEEAKTFNNIGCDRYPGGFNTLLPHMELGYYLQGDCLRFLINSLVVR